MFSEVDQIKSDLVNEWQCHLLSCPGQLKIFRKNIIWTWGGGGITSYMVNAIHCIVANIVWLKSEGGLAVDITSSLENSKTANWFLKVVFKRKKVPHFLNGIFHQFWEFMNFERNFESRGATLVLTSTTSEQPLAYLNQLN